MPIEALPPVVSNPDFDVVMPAEGQCRARWHRRTPDGSLRVSDICLSVTEAVLTGLCDDYGRVRSYSLADHYDRADRLGLNTGD